MRMRLRIPERSTITLVVLLSGSIFVTETIIAHLLPNILTSVGWIKTIVDSSLFILVTLPFLYFFSFRPLKNLTTRLRESEERLRNTFEQAAVGIAHVSPDGAFLRVNNCWCEIVGYSREELMTMSFQGLTHPDDLYNSASLLQSFLDGEHRASTAEKRYVRKDKSVIWVDLSISLVRNPNGEPNYFISVIEDVTEHKHAETALRESENKLNVILESTADGILAVDGKGKVLRTNKRFAELWKIPQSLVDSKDDNAMLNYVLSQLVEPEAFLSKVRLLYGSTDEDTDRLRFKDGRMFERYSAPILMGGVSAGRVWSFRDITDRTRAEEALRESEERYRSIIHASPDNITIAELDGSIIMVSPIAVSMFGFEREEQARGLPITDFIVPEDRGRAMSNIALKIQGGLPSSNEYRGVRMDGSTFDIEVNSDLIRGIDGQPNKIVIIARDITKRKQAEVALRESDKKFRTLYESSRDALMTLTPPSWLFTSCNKATVEMFRAKNVPEFISFGPAKVSPEYQPDGRLSQEKAEEMIEKAMREGSHYFEWTHKRIDGEEFPATVLLTRMELEGKQFLHATVRDITERKRAEEKLRRSEERYRSFFENAPVGVFYSTTAGKIIRVNGEYARILGYASPEEVKEIVNQSTIAESIYANADERPYVVRKAIATSGNWMVMEQHLRRKDGTHITANVIMRALPDYPEHLEGFVEDITERKRTEDQLRKLSLAIEQSPASIVITDTKGNIEYVNPKFTQVTGYSMEESRGQKPSILKSGEMALEEYKKLWETITSGNDWRGEFHNKKKSGELFWETASISPVKNKDNVVTNFVAVKEDITERKHTEEALRQAQKLESIGTLAGGIAHDFNNVLGGIMGYTEMSLQYTEKDSKLEKNLHKVLKATDRAKHLIEQILTFSRKTNPQKSIITIRPIIKEVLDLLRASIPSSVIIESFLDKNTKSVLADPTKLHEMLLNLATNAVHAMERKGTMTVRLYGLCLDRMIHGQAGEIPPGEYTVIEVADTGCGMDIQTLSRAFEPFFTTKAVGEGTGMGLSVVLGVVQSLGGDIQVQSEKGKGTTFKLYLPVAEESDSNTGNDDSMVELYGTERILFVDDEKMLADMVEDMLTPLGYTVVSVCNSSDALLYMNEHGNDIDILITDQTMPGMTGIELAKEVLKIRKNTPVILCTGFSNEINPERAATIGVNQLLMKPYTVSEIGKAIRKILDNRK